MRRTYRSKKETGGGMDPRDVVLAMDEKGSVFDAFYIENIKQTKRDLSVGASTFAASNKVRKRKYVKRLKEQEPILRDTRESMSRSGYLTPDKSIHLKRELDPFDLLLSSSTNEVPSKPSKINVFRGSPLHTRGKGKTYRKKVPINKKFEYSSSKDTDSDKENSLNRSDETQNQSDILSHKLEIEKEEKSISNKIDESIVNIVTDFSLLDNIQNLNSASPLSSTMKDKLSISSVQKSPTCSTPFHKKYRGKSIYKFSPISVDIDDKHCTIAENIEEITENKKELNNVPNATAQFAYYINCNNKSVDYDEINSPILPCRDVTDKNRTKMLEHHHTITEEISLLQTSEQGPFLGFPIKKSWGVPNINLEPVIIKYLERKENNLEVLQQSQCTDLTNEKKNSNLNGEHNQNSSLENGNDASLNPDTRQNQFVIVKPLENLIGSKLEGNNKSEDQLNLEDCKDQNNETNQGSINRPDEEASSETYLEKSIVDNAHSLIKENTLESSQTYSEKNCVVENKHSMNEENTLKTSRTYSEQGTSSSDESEHALSYENSSEDEMEQNTFEPSQTQTEENSSIKSEHSLVEKSISEKEVEQNSSEQLTNSEENSTVENESSLTEKGTFNISKDIESFYESCNSDNEMSDIDTDKKELFVVLERLNDSVFKKYYNKDALSIGDSSQCDERSNESYSSENSNNIYTSLNENETLSESTKSTSNDEIGDDLQEDTLINISNIDQDVDYNYEINKPDDDVFVSFVTRRRRNEKTKDSFILSFDNSLTSTSSSDFNKTVLTNSKRSTNSLLGNNDITLCDDAHEEIDGVLVNKSEICDGDISLLQRENTIIETELSPLPKIKSTGVVSRKSAGLSRRSAKLSAENLSRESGTREIDLNSRKSVASKINTTKTRKSSKLTRNKMDKESIHEGNDCISRSSIASKKTSTKIRKSYKLSTDNNINNEFSNESNDECTSTNSFVVPIMTRKSSRMYEECVNRNHSIQKFSPPKCNINPCYDTIDDMSEMKHIIVLEPGKRWERSLSIYRRVTTMGDHFDQSMLDDEQLTNKGRKYRQSVISTMEMQDTTVSLHNESVKSRRSTLFSKPSRSTIKILRESNASRISLSSTLASEDLGFLSEDCDDTLVELSKLSIIDSDHEVTVLDKFNDTSNRITTARDYVLRRCNQTDVIPFDECYPDTLLKNCRKIGEGVYGEVFLWRARDGRARVLKVVPIAGSTKVNGESQKDYHEIISEIVIAMELSALRAPIIEIEKHLDEGQGVETLDLHSVENATDVFNEVLAVRCVYGSYPSRLLDLWELYDECKGSENDNPAILPADQQFMVLELANAGQDLESYQFHNAEQAYALFQQVAFGLAVAEEAFQFEHRDLHWGNVLIAPTDQKYATFVLRGRAHRVARRGVAATIIDYSLSRLSLRLPADTAALYNDLATDDGLFDAVGDYQFQVYRLMRDKLGNDWKNFEPYTNILWLHYTVDKMITALRYTRTNTKIHKHYIAKLKEIKNRILDYGSAVQYVLTDNEI